MKALLHYQGKSLDYRRSKEMGLQEVTEDRIEQLKEAMISLLEERMRTSINQINRYVEENLDSVLDSLQGSITKLYQKVADAQKEEVLGAVQFINTFFMKGEVQEGNLVVKIAAYDETGIDNKADISELWYPEFISKYYRADMEYLQKNLDRKFFRPSNRERMIAALLYAEDYYKIVSNLLIACREAFEFVEGIDWIKVADTVSVSGGYYQEQGTCFYQFQECEVWKNL